MSAHNDSAFLRMFLMVLGALVAFTIVILILANQITGSVEEARGPDPRLQQAIAERIRPVGSVNVAVANVAPAAPQSGAEVAAAACNACHVAGVLGAPKTGDKAAWEARLAAGGGVDGLTASVINGKGSMPARGGASASDDELRAAVEHLLAESGVDVAAAADTATAAPAESAPAPESAGLVEDVKQMAGNAVDAAATAATSVVAAVMPGTAPVAPAAPEAAPPAAAAAAAAPQPVAAAAPAVDLAKGKQVYDSACFVCHLAAVAGAPKLGDKAAWAPRIATGMDALNTSALNGKGAMPPKGGRMDISDEDVISAVAYMVEQSK